MSRTFQIQATSLIDDLKSVCANYGLGNDGNEYKIITQIFLYKFLNDKRHIAASIATSLPAGRNSGQRPEPSAPIPAFHQIPNVF
jgi:hypothetical protein